MSFSTEFSSGVRAYSQAHRVISKFGLYKYLWLPGVVTIVYAVLFFLVALHFASNLESDAAEYPWWLRWMGDFTIWFVEFVYWGLVVGFFAVTLKYVVQVLLSPLLSNLSVAVEKKLTGKEPPKLTMKESMQDIRRSLQLSFRNMFYEIFLCIAASFIPLVGPLVAIAISSFYYGFGYMDYVMERKRMDVGQAVTFAKKHRGLTTGLGLVIYFLMYLPVIGWLIGPTYATVAATLETLRIVDPSVKLTV
jgi:CysZ protein